MIAHYKRRWKDFEYLSLKYNLQELTHDLASYNLVPRKILRGPKKLLNKKRPLVVAVVLIL